MDLQILIFTCYMFFIHLGLNDVKGRGDTFFRLYLFRGKMRILAKLETFSNWFFI